MMALSLEERHCLISKITTGENGANGRRAKHVLARAAFAILFFAFVLSGRSQLLTVSLSGANELPANTNEIPAYGEIALGYHSITNGFVCYLVLPYGRWHVGIYGPAAPGSNGPLIFDLGPGVTNGSSSIMLDYTLIKLLTIEQMDQLFAGLWYLNVSSDLFPDGEFRGQILPSDSDHDGVPDYLDQCPGTPPGSVVDAQGCSIEQLCPCEGPWKNHGHYMQTLAQVTDRFQRDGLITRADREAILKKGATSDCGKPDGAAGGL
jgi:hypothetical protein